jgi:nucleoid DNA-binding protein
VGGVDGSNYVYNLIVADGVVRYVGNRATGAAVQIAASKKVAFRAANELKTAV